MAMLEETATRYVLRRKGANLAVTSSLSISKTLMAGDGNNEDEGDCGISPVIERPPSFLPSESTAGWLRKMMALCRRDGNRAKDESAKPVWALARTMSRRSQPPGFSASIRQQLFAGASYRGVAACAPLSAQPRDGPAGLSSVPPAVQPRGDRPPNAAVRQTTPGGRAPCAMRRRVLHASALC